MGPRRREGTREVRSEDRRRCPRGTVGRTGEDDLAMGRLGKARPQMAGRMRWTAELSWDWQKRHVESRAQLRRRRGGGVVC